MISQPPISQPEPVRGEQREDRAAAGAVVDQQQRGRHAEGEAQREGEDRDLAVVGEQEGREDGRAPLLAAVVERARAATRVEALEIAPAGHARRDRGCRTSWDRGDEQIAGERRRRR